LWNDKWDLFQNTLDLDFSKGTGTLAVLVARAIVAIGNCHGGILCLNFHSRLKGKSGLDNNLLRSVVPALEVSISGSGCTSREKFFVNLQDVPGEKGLRLFIPPFSYEMSQRYFHTAYKRTERECRLVSPPELQAWPKSSKVKFDLGFELVIKNAVVIGQETSTMEFKETVTEYARLLDYVCGFRNGLGGHLCVGVKDSLQVVGISQTFFEKIRSFLVQSLSGFYPPISVEDFCAKFECWENEKGLAFSV
jgi:hypothetical protein